MVVGWSAVSGIPLDVYALVSALVSVNIGFDDTNVQFESDVDVPTVYVIYGTVSPRSYKA